MQQTLSPTALRFLGNLPLEAELAPAPAPEVAASRDVLFLDALRANLHAAARHAALGHTATSFRECSGPACMEAARMLPEIDPNQAAATDAELEAILDEVLTTLEKEGTSFLALKPS